MFVGNLPVTSMLLILSENISLHSGDADFTAIGSEEMKSFGVNLLFSYTDINLIGFTSVLKNFKKLKDKLNQAIRFINDTSPDAVILLDSPGFNLRLMQNIRSFYTGKNYLLYITATLGMA